MIDLENYLLDHAGWDWSALLRHWRWLVPLRFAPWLVNRFGDVIMKLPDRSIHHLDIGNGSFKRVADNRDQFSVRCEDPDEANFFLMISLIDQLVAAGRTLQPGQCYSYAVAPAFGGTYASENVLIKSISDHYDIFGPLHRLTKDIPDGTVIEFTTNET
jgi:hypothetical protein